MADGRFVQSHRQASIIHDNVATGAPRLKNLFYIRFNRVMSPSTVLSANAGTTSTTSQLNAQTGWQRNLAFYCKSVERPSVSPIAEELNQYNKRRQVYTGYKVGPMRMTFYDTADSLAHQMWSEYNKFYFGDFNHDTKESDFDWDVTLDAFKDDAGAGFGFNPKAALSTNTDPQAHFFFKSISVFQVYGGKFVQYDLVNPKITSFDPTELSYEDSGVGTINISVVYEAIIYINNSTPQPLSADSQLAADFQQPQLASQGRPNVDPGVFEPSLGITDTPSAAPAVTTIQSGSANDFSAPTTTAQPNPTPAGNVGTGSLSSYGNFVFGQALSTDAIQAAASDLSAAAANNPALASVLNILPPISLADTSSRLLANPSTMPVEGLSPAQVDAAQAAIAAMNNGTLGGLSISDALVAGILAGALLRGTSPVDHATGNNQLAVSEDALGIVNSQSSPTSQIGVNTASS